jgi:hypothetical protein
VNYLGLSGLRRLWYRFPHIVAVIILGLVVIVFPDLNITLSNEGRRL